MAEVLVEPPRRVALHAGHDLLEASWVYAVVECPRRSVTTLVTSPDVEHQRRDGVPEIMQTDAWHPARSVSWWKAG